MSLKIEMTSLDFQKANGTSHKKLKTVQQDKFINKLEFTFILELTPPKKYSF